MRSLVILPTYNEAPNVLPLCRDVLAKVPELDVLVVDDDSPDGTGDVVERETGREPRLRLLRRPGKLGLGSAYLAGFRLALDRGYANALTMDCDLSHDPRYLPDLLAAMRSCDLAIGSRYVAGGSIENWPLHRRALSAFANMYTRTLLRLPVRDCTSGYRCYSRRALETVDPFDSRSSGYAFLEEMVWRVHCAGLRIAEVPILFVDRLRGASKISQTEIYRAAWHVLSTTLRARGAARRGSPPGPGG